MKEPSMFWNWVGFIVMRIIQIFLILGAIGVVVTMAGGLFGA